MYKTMGVFVDEEGWQGTTAHEVIVEDDLPVFTGLVDASGVKIYRTSDRIPLGFDLTIK